MNTDHVFRSTSITRRAVFPAVWVLGFLFGMIFASFAGDSYYSLMRRAASLPVSIAGLLPCVLLPFLFAAFAACITKPSLVLGLCFFKTFLFSMGAFGIRGAFGDSGWLIRFLLQFSDICTLPLLCWFSIRHYRGNDRSLVRDLLICSGSALVIGLLDSNVISPFLVMLIEY